MKIDLKIIVLITTIIFLKNVVAQNDTQKGVDSFLKTEYASIEEFKNSVIVINILDIKNIDEITKLNKLTEKYINHNVVFIAITDNSNEQATDYLKQSLLYYQYLTKDENERVFNEYQTAMFKVFPIHILINQIGKVTYKKKGTVKNIDKKLGKRIDALLNKMPLNDIKSPIYVYTKS